MILGLIAQADDIVISGAEKTPENTQGGFTLEILLPKII